MATDLLPNVPNFPGIIMPGNAPFTVGQHNAKGLPTIGGGVALVPEGDRAYSFNPLNNPTPDNGYDDSGDEQDVSPNIKSFQDGVPESHSFNSENMAHLGVFENNQAADSYLQHMNKSDPGHIPAVDNYTANAKHLPAPTLMDPQIALNQMNADRESRLGQMAQPANQAPAKRPDVSRGTETTDDDLETHLA